MKYTHGGLLTLLIAIAVPALQLQVATGQDWPVWRGPTPTTPSTS